MEFLPQTPRDLGMDTAPAGLFWEYPRWDELIPEESQDPWECSTATSFTPAHPNWNSNLE